MDAGPARRMGHRHTSLPAASNYRPSETALYRSRQRQHSATCSRYARLSELGCWQLDRPQQPRSRLHTQHACGTVLSRGQGGSPDQITQGGRHVPGHAAQRRHRRDVHRHGRHARGRCARRGRRWAGQHAAPRRGRGRMGRVCSLQRCSRPARQTAVSPRTPCRPQSPPPTRTRTRTMTRCSVTPRPSPSTAEAGGAVDQDADAPRSLPSVWRCDDSTDVCTSAHDGPCTS